MLALVGVCHTSLFRSLVTTLSKVSSLGGRESSAMMKAEKDSGSPSVSANMMSSLICLTQFCSFDSVRFSLHAFNRHGTLSLGVAFSAGPLGLTSGSFSLVCIHVLSTGMAHYR